MFDDFYGWIKTFFPVFIIATIAQSLHICNDKQQPRTIKTFLVGCMNAWFVGYITMNLCLFYNLSHHISVSIVSIAAYGGGRTMEIAWEVMEFHLKNLKKNKNK